MSRARSLVTIDTRPQRLLGVVDEVEHDLLELCAITENHRQRRLELEPTSNAYRLQGIATRPCDVPDNVIDAGRHFSCAVAPSCQCKQISDDRRGTDGLVIDRFERGAVISRPGFPEKEL